MVGIPETVTYEAEITRVEATDVALGGNLVNVPNKQFSQIANRFAWLKGQVDSLLLRTDVGTQQGRLSLDSSDPTPTGDLSGTSLFLVPYSGDQITLYSNSAWSPRPFTIITLNFGGKTPNVIYDVFARWNGSAVILEEVAWSGGSRAETLTRLNGVLVSSANNSRRYIGTVYYDGFLRDGKINRWLWNYNNRVPTLAKIEIALPNHTYASNTFRYYANDSTKQVSVVCGLPCINDVAIHAGVGHNGSIALGVDFSQSGTYTGIRHEQTTATTAPASLGTSQAIEFSPGFHELHLLQSTSVGQSAVYEAANYPETGIFAKWDR